ncbi:unnamed protein product [Rotaria socialis]|uniref:HTH psq-type domain-containing protein n=2 Tax=Rotaria TaxID=231623 RepID=A0A817MML3_9BILA|nr:unnamed protein product [Rotaria socialis]CAF4530397.1 unnamed protein product [Rotaria socialis]
MYEVEEIEEHLLSMPSFNANSILEESDSDDESCVEVTPDIDENENELVEWAKYLQLNSDSDADQPSTPSATLVDYSSSEASSDNENSLESTGEQTNASDKHNINFKPISPSTVTKKRKRRQWTIEEKLYAVACFEKNDNKHKTAQQVGCATKQLRMWIQNKNELLSLSSRKKSKKRKRLDGAGKKLTYIDLDSRLFAWHREKRTDPTSTTKIGRQLSEELNHQCPSSKWFGLFLVRHHLSLQRPKRHQKIPLQKVHKKGTSFFSFLRRASRWAPKRGEMGAFTPRDIFNMDESPLALFGDQAKRSINDINTCNEVEGCLSNKRFCTVILTVSGEDQRVGPVLLFKGKGRVANAEETQYARCNKQLGLE